MGNHVNNNTHVRVLPEKSAKPDELGVVLLQGKKGEFCYYGYYLVNHFLWLKKFALQWAIFMFFHTWLKIPLFSLMPLCSFFF